MFLAMKLSKRISILRMISPLVLKLCFPQIENILFREKSVQSFQNEKLKLISDYF